MNSSTDNLYGWLVRQKGQVRVEGINVPALHIATSINRLKDA